MSCKNKNCGCQDSSYTTGSPCTSPECLNPEPCSEVFSDCCILHDGDSILEYNINQGDKVCEIIQKLILAIKNPACLTGCVPPTGFKSVTATTTTVSLYWSPVTDATAYQVEYKLQGDMSWSLSSVLTTNSITIQGLTSNSTYYFRVKSFCDETPSCYSVTIIVNTKA